MNFSALRKKSEVSYDKAAVYAEPTEQHNELPAKWLQQNCSQNGNLKGNKWKTVRQAQILQA